MMDLLVLSFEVWDGVVVSCFLCCIITATHIPRKILKGVHRAGTVSNVPTTNSHYTYYEPTLPTLNALELSHQLVLFLL